MKKPFLVVFLPLFLLAACDSSSSDGSSNHSLAEVNVASIHNGGTALAVYHADTAENIIDEDDETTWISDPDSPIVIEFERAEKIVSFALYRTNSGASVGSNPDIVIEFSKNGTDYVPSNATYAFGNPDAIPCISSTTGPEVIKCQLQDPYTMKFVRITTKNGKSYEFKEFEAIALK